MKLNAKDIASALLLLLVAVAGLYWNGSGLPGHVGEHSLGTARRMGPGYMPMLVFWIQFGLGALILLIALRSGPDPLQRWSGLDWGSLALSVGVGTGVFILCTRIGDFYNSGYNALGFGMLAGFLVMCWAEGWRLLGFVCASMCAFAILLEQGGLMAATVGTTVVSAMADPEHRRKPLGVLGMTVFLSLLCWWIFIDGLDIRVAVWPDFLKPTTDPLYAAAKGIIDPIKSVVGDGFRFLASIFRGGPGRP
jgi:hypothetical protein